MTDRLIYAEKLKAHYAWWANGSEMDKLYKAIFDSIINLHPTVEAVEVVRCKECKHRDVETGFCGGRGWPMQIVPGTGFCDKGERRENG